jgi:hypothetical protein
VYVGSDSLTSVDSALELKGKSEIMQLVTRRIRDLPEVLRRRNQLRLGHVYGEGNTFADAESRGKSDVVLSLARQVRIEYRHARIPKRAFGLLNDVFAEYKALVDARVGPLMAAYADRQPRCNWTAAEHEADEFDAAMPLSKRIRTLREDGVEYDEVAASHWVSRKHERAEIDTQPPRQIAAGGVYGGAPRAGAQPQKRPRSALRSEEHTLGEESANVAKDGAAPDGCVPGGKHAGSMLPPPPATPPRRKASKQPLETPPRAPPAPRRSPPQRPLLARSSPARMARIQLSPSISATPSGFHAAPMAAAPTVVPKIEADGAPSRASAAAMTARAPPAPPNAPMASELYSLLRADNSELRIGLADDDTLMTLCSEVSEACMLASPASTLKADASQFKFWEDICKSLNTTPWRRRGADTTSDEHTYFRREAFLQAIAMLIRYRTMKPRRQSDPAPRPQSAANMVLAVRRVHARAQIPMAPCPTLAIVLRYLTRRYVDLHGPEALLPQQKEPLTVDDRRAIYAIADGTKVGRFTVRWTDPLFVGFRAALDTMCDTGQRKSDLLCAASAATGLDTARSNLTWKIGGEIVTNPTPEQLSQLKDGDLAILRPAGSKNDAFAQFFGNKPMWLPYSSSHFSAAASLAKLAAMCPIDTSLARRVPLIVVDRSFQALTYAKADELFRALVEHAVPHKRGMLSLHSCRIFKACALRAAGAQPATMQAEVRWKNAESVEIYARTNPEVSANWIHRMYEVETSALTTRNLAQTDYDSFFAGLARTCDQLEKNIDANVTDDCVATCTTRGPELERAIVGTTVCVKTNAADDVYRVGEITHVSADKLHADVRLRDATSVAHADTAGVVKVACVCLYQVPCDTDDEIDDNAAGGSHVADTNATAASARDAQTHVVLTAPPPPAAPRAARRRVRPEEQITVRQQNPKRAGSGCYERYERYKAAKTRGEFAQLGGTSGDFNHDLKKGFITFRG